MDRNELNKIVLMWGRTSKNVHPSSTQHVKMLGLWGFFLKKKVITTRSGRDCSKAGESTESGQLRGKNVLSVVQNQHYSYGSQAELHMELHMISDGSYFDKAM